MGGVTTRHVWDGQNIVLDLNGDYSTKMSFVRGIRLVSYKNAAGERSVYNFNVRGDVLGITKDTSGAPARYQYDAFGNEITNEENKNPFRYCGEYTDAETNLIYLRARYYEPATGQFTTQDPAKSGLNWYSYCNGNPVMFKDSSGEDAIVLTAEDAVAYQGHTSALVED